jgi:hypothetical protein
VIIVLGVPTLVESPDRDRAGGSSGDVAMAIAEAGGAVQVAGKLGDDPAGDRVLLALAGSGVGHAAMLRDPALTTPVRSAAPVEPSASGGVAWTPRPADGEEDAPVAFGLLVEAADERNGSDGTSDTDETALPQPGAVPPPAEAMVPLRMDASGPAERPILLDAADIELALRYLVDFRVLIVATPLDDTSARVVAESAAYAGAQVIALDESNGVMPDLGPATVLEVPASDPDGRFADLVARFAIGLDRGTPAGEAFRAALGTAGWERIGP